MVQLCYRIIHPLFWVVNRSECTSPKRNNWQVLGINNLPEHKTMSFSVDPSFWSQASVRISGGAAVAGMDGAGADGADGADSEAATLDLGRMAWNFQRKKKKQTVLEKLEKLEARRKHRFSTRHKKRSSLNSLDVHPSTVT